MDKDRTQPNFSIDAMLRVNEYTRMNMGSLNNPEWNHVWAIHTASIDLQAIVLHNNVMPGTNLGLTQLQQPPGQYRANNTLRVMDFLHNPCQSTTSSLAPGSVAKCPTWGMVAQ